MAGCRDRRLCPLAHRPGLRHVNSTTIICWSDDDAKRHNEFEAEVIRLLAQDGPSIALNARWLAQARALAPLPETLATAGTSVPRYGWPEVNAEGHDLRY